MKETLDEEDYQSISKSEFLSAVLDDEVNEKTKNKDHCLANLSKNDYKTWSTYHLIGEALRSSDAAHLKTQPNTHHFVERVSKQLSNEPKIEAPAAIKKLTLYKLFEQRPLPSLAIAASVITLTWMLMPIWDGGHSQNETTLQLTTLTNSNSYHRPLVWNNEGNEPNLKHVNFIHDLDENPYYYAHQEFSTDPVLQVSTPYVHSSTLVLGE